MTPNVLITGASGQIGSLLCRKFSEKKYNVLAVDISNPENALENINYYTCDVTDIPNKKLLYDTMVHDHGKIDLLINNAGISCFTDFEDRTEEEFDAVFDVNLKSVFFDIQNFVRKYDELKQQQGKIINIGSIFGVVSPDFRNYVDLNRKSPEIYGASKAGLIQMSKYFAVHLAERNIAVNCVSPGGIYNSKQPQGPEFVELYSSKTPQHRMATTDEVVEAIMLLASLESNYTTGQNLIIDGGLTSW
tara:strand:+ start:67 stop:807 length:741 start_codon:yes stop_codon:yes gene_type:complete